MKFIDEYHNTELSQRLISHIHKLSRKHIRLMEFCGGHTVAILKNGLRQVLPPTIEMLSGPGCPVCVTSNADLDTAIAMSKLPGIIMATFGDMLKVPGSYSSLQQAKAEGSDIRIVYSTMDALKIARARPEKSVIFLGIGFETTAPTIAASILEAKKGGLKNYFVFSAHKVCPPVIKAILDSGEIKLDGIICPGHVSSIIGSRPYEFVPQNYKIGCVIAGFEPVDILLCVAMLVAQIEKYQPRVEIAYRRSVRPEGNTKALEIMYEVFETASADWRGIGLLPQSGLQIKEKYGEFDARKHFPVKIPPPQEPKGCLCGEILRGVKTPLDCRLYRVHCHPEHPVGPCMVSSEGTCATYYLYRENIGR